MWTAKYTDINKGGLNPELKVTILYSNGTDGIEKVYDVLPDDLNGKTFQTVIQNQIDILNDKESVTGLDTLLDTDVDLNVKPK